jgi:hypothetical protein
VDRGEQASSPEQIQEKKDKALLKDIARPEDTAQCGPFLGIEQSKDDYRY